MSPSPAWYMHGCYTGSSAQYFEMPLESARDGCKDVTNTYDHRDPSHPIRGIIRQLYHLRTQFPTLNDGLLLDNLSKQTEMIAYPGSSGVETETGLWSVRRAPFDGVQDFGGPSDIWLVYHNRNETTKYSFDCSSNDSAIISPFDSGTTVKNLMFPHDELELVDGPKKLYLNSSEEFNGCVGELEFAPFEFRIYVPNDRFIPPPPMVTKFLPGHDFPYLRDSSEDPSNSVDISLHFNVEMDCEMLTQNITIISSTFDQLAPRIDEDSVSCGNVTENERAPYVGAIASAWYWSARLLDVADGVHQIVVKDAVTVDGGSSTGSTDKFLLRVGQADNPIVFLSANYSQSLLSRQDNGEHTVSHKAAGADMWRYSLNWGSSWSDWQNLDQIDVTLEKQPWSGTKLQEWKGSHVMVQYWSRLLGSSSFIQHGDVDFAHERRFPHLFANGAFNQFGFDAGQRNQFEFETDGAWSLHVMHEWPSTLQLNVWGMNPDGQPDQSFVYGDIDGDGVLDRLNPASLLINSLNITKRPPYPYLAYRVQLNDANLRYELFPVGNQWLQLALFAAFAISPLVAGLVAVGIFQGSFYKVKYVARGVGRSVLGTFLSTFSKKKRGAIAKPQRNVLVKKKRGQNRLITTTQPQGDVLITRDVGEIVPPSTRRKVLIATIEYNIDDWNIKVKIGGLGVMAQLMGKALSHLNLVWVVPCTDGIEYPDNEDERAEPMEIKILDNLYSVSVHYHVVDNITFVILDAPIFRTTNKANPYPPRMDDISSAVYYSTWNQCIAQALQRFEVDLYHINDYHGAAAPLYLLPKTIPCCLSLHNAEFQGLWPMRTADERDEVARVFNLPPKIVRQYIQYGSVFNLLHAGASYLRIHQSGFGAVGVSKKYGDRSYARYPIFWGLSSVGQLPNPDPSDIAEWDKHAVIKKSEVLIDQAYEAGRGAFRVQAQEWAGLEIDAEAQLFVFVGRWSEQKGVDLIADVFPSILEDYPKSQLICVGPVIDLYGKFAALKLSRLMKQYPKRVFSRPEFTMLPPYIHTGAEFALIPSRDEPFGLVAVEFGRKGALGVGARVGGLGQMPGWWYTVESVSTTHLLKQLKTAIISALESKESDRALMRAWSAKQRFPVAQWLEGLGKLQDQAVQIHQRNQKVSAGSRPQSLLPTPTSMPTPPRGVHLRAISSPILATRSSSRASSHHENDLEMNRPKLQRSAQTSNRTSVVDLGEILGERKDFALQQVDPFFTDSNEEFYNVFKQKLEQLNARNSTTDLCTEEYIVESTRAWFSRRHDAKVGVHSLFSSASSSTVSLKKKGRVQVHLQETDSLNSSEDERNARSVDHPSRTEKDDFDFGENFVPPTGLRK
jgi:alpha-1,3-glucan synthase